MGILFITSHATENCIGYPSTYYHVCLLYGARLYGKTYGAVKLYGQR